MWDQKVTHGRLLKIDNNKFAYVGSQIDPYQDNFIIHEISSHDCSIFQNNPK